MSQPSSTNPLVHMVQLALRLAVQLMSSVVTALVQGFTQAIRGNTSAPPPDDPEREDL